MEIEKMKNIFQLPKKWLAPKKKKLVQEGETFKVWRCPDGMVKLEGKMPLKEGKGVFTLNIPFKEPD